jgi:hypothetical protein
MVSWAMGAEGGSSCIQQEKDLAWCADLGAIIVAPLSQVVCPPLLFLLLSSLFALYATPGNSSLALPPLA